MESGPWKLGFQGLGRVFAPLRSMEPMLGNSRIQARQLPEPLRTRPLVHAIPFVADRFFALAVFILIIELPRCSR